MQDVGLPGRAVPGGAPHAQAAALGLGVLVLQAALGPGRRVLRAAGAIAVGAALALQALLRPLPLLAVPASRCCMPARPGCRAGRMPTDLNHPWLLTPSHVTASKRGVCCSGTGCRDQALATHSGWKPGTGMVRQAGDA